MTVAFELVTEQGAANVGRSSGRAGAEGRREGESPTRVEGTANATSFNATRAKQGKRRTCSDAQTPVRNRFWPFATSRRNDTEVGRELLNKSLAINMARYSPTSVAHTDTSAPCSGGTEAGNGRGRGGGQTKVELGSIGRRTGIR